MFKFNPQSNRNSPESKRSINDRSWTRLFELNCAGVFALIFFLSSAQMSLAMTLEERVQVEVAHPDPLFSESLAQTLRQKHVVIVDGIMNELTKVPRNYFTDYIRVLRKNGISYTHLGYSSRVAIPNNAHHLIRDLHRVSDRVHKPIILIGHSMGGAESLYSVLNQPSLLIDGTIDKVIVFEGAIGGSPLAEHWKDKGLAKMMKKILGPGLDSLRPSVARRNFDQIREKYELAVREHFSPQGDGAVEEALRKLSNRVFYVQSESPAHQRLSWGLRVILPFVDREAMGESDNDGLLRLEDQILSGFGTSLGVFTADHIELVVSGPVSHSNSNYRKAFARALFKTLYGENGEFSGDTTFYEKVIAEANLRDEAPPETELN